MTYRSAYAIKGFDALRANPLRWFLSELTVYVTAAVAVGLAFMLASALYAYLWAAPQPEATPSVLEEPRLLAPEESPSTIPQRSPDSLNSGLIAARKVSTISIRGGDTIERTSPDGGGSTDVGSVRKVQFVMIDNRGILQLPNSDLSYNFRLPVHE